MRLRCPECGGRTGTRTSRPVSKTVAEAYLSCPGCGCRFRVIAEIVGIVVHGEVYSKTTPLPMLKEKIQQKQ